MDVKEVQNALQPWIMSSKPMLVLLFGSTVTGLKGPESDVDVGVLFGRKVDVSKELSGISQKFDQDEIDLMLLDSADPVARMAACEGIMIHEDKPGRFAEFQSLSLRQFMDTERIRRAQEELLDEFLAKRGCK